MGNEEARDLLGTSGFVEGRVSGEYEDRSDWGDDTEKAIPLRALTVRSFHIFCGA